MRANDRDNNGYTRREFLGETSCAAVAGSAALGSILNLGLLGTLAADELPPGDDYRALVCVFLAGGHDSFNMLVPKGSSEHLEYAEIRRNLSLSRQTLLPFSYTAPGQKELGLHPELHKVRDSYDSGNLAFVTNVGTLQQPVTKETYELSPQLLPDGLFSHSDQQKQWHTSLPDRSSTSGWLGRLSALVRDLNQPGSFASAISVAGVNLLQTSPGVLPYVIGTDGSKGLVDWDKANWAHGRTAVTSQLELEYENLLQKIFVGRKKDALERNKMFSEAVGSDDQEEIQISGGSLGKQLEMVLKTIQAREDLGVRRQTFFVELGGWDLHTSLLEPHRLLLEQLDDALGDFQTALKENGLSNQVTTFTASDFGRSLTSNGQGSDHGWGGHQMIMGGAVNGGKIYGEYPDLYEDSPLDVGRGRLIPTTSVDEYFAELACWFGVSRQQLPLVFPNLNRFYDLARPEQPLGFMNLG
ncbi:MAG: DUF1501 domain-containing protein [Akkermansiaceae bacterium]|jgi:uncharacterized protein (DUF1501 family)